MGRGKGSYKYAATKSEKKELVNKSMRDSLGLYYRQAQDLSEQEYLENQKEIKKIIPKEDFDKIKKATNEHLSQGKNKSFGLVLLISLLMRVQDSPNKINPCRLTGGKNGNYSITNSYKRVFQEEQGAYALDEMEMKILTVAKHSNGVIRDSIADVGVIKSGIGALKKSKPGSFYFFIGEIQDNYLKKNKKLSEMLLLDFLYTLNREATKGRKIQKSPDKIEGYVSSTEMIRKLTEFGKDSKTNGRRTENLVYSIEELFCQQKGINDIKKSNVNSSDNKFIGDIQYTFFENKKQKTICIDPKDKPLLKNDLIQFRDKLNSFEFSDSESADTETSTETLKGYLVYTGNNNLSSQEIADVVKKMPQGKELVPIDWDSYLTMRINELEQDQLQQIPSKVNKMSTTGEIELFEKI